MSYVLRHSDISALTKKRFRKLTNSEKSYLEFSTLKLAIQILFHISLRVSRKFVQNLNCRL